MGFEHEWDTSCPHVWDQWEQNGKSWVIQDLPPEDEETALQILLKDLAGDEPLCIQSRITEDEESMTAMGEVWREYLAKRTSLGRYTDVNGEKTLVALNCCTVAFKDDHEHPDIAGNAWKNVYGVLAWLEEQADAFEHIGDDKLLSALGLVVTKDFRGAKLGGRLLKAREPLCKSLGLKGTATVFTGPASQKLAANNGFKTIAEATWTDLANSGLDYPKCDRIVNYANHYNETSG